MVCKSEAYQPATLSSFSNLMDFCLMYQISVLHFALGHLSLILSPLNHEFPNK